MLPLWFPCRSLTHPTAQLGSTLQFPFLGHTEQDHSTPKVSPLGHTEQASNNHDILLDSFSSLPLPWIYQGGESGPTRLLGQLGFEPVSTESAAPPNKRTKQLRERPPLLRVLPKTALESLVPPSILASNMVPPSILASTMVIPRNHESAFLGKQAITLLPWNAELDSGSRLPLSPQSSCPRPFVPLVPSRRSRLRRL
jgi:hypothetical protein